MKNLSFFGLLLTLFCASTQAHSATFAERNSYRSAARLPGEDWRQSMKRLQLAYTKVHGHRPKLSDKSAAEMAIELDQLDTTVLPMWPNSEAMNAAFDFVRDARFLVEADKKDFLRRISWLYPDDGCFARASVGVHKLSETKLPLPYKVFIFGNLSVKTPNSPGGRVDWSYHVAPIIAVEGQAFVLDAAINPMSPTPLREWVMTMVKDVHDARVSICHTNTYVPDQSCLSSTAEDDDEADADQQEYLYYEWNRLENMNRLPEKELGDEPPWKQAGSIN